MTLRPRRSKRQIVCSDFFKKSERIYFAAPPSQITTAALGCDLGSPLCGVFRFCRNIGFNRYLHKNNHTFRCGYFYAYREDFTCPAEVNSACTKVLALGQNTCTAQKRRGPEGRFSEMLYLFRMHMPKSRLSAAAESLLFV